jgi:uncharacterized protein YbjQ (UPF0145 family)
MEYLQLWIFAGLLLLGLVAGSIIEYQHLQDLRQREQKVRQFSVISFGANQPLPNARKVMLVSGSVVLTSDTFRTFVASLISLVGGNIGVYESLMNRGRREAILRMKEQAIAQGATQVLNLKIETARISSEANNAAAVIEIIAYGTAIR